MDFSILNKISYGLYILTANQDGLDNGCIINTAALYTNEPNRIGVTVNKSNFTNEMIAKTGKFNVSILSEEADFELFRHFGFSSGREKQKFSDFTDFRRSENGITYITKGTNAWISASVVQTVDLGTHTLFLADVTDLQNLSDSPSLTYAYYHQHIKPKPKKDAPAKTKTVWRCEICGYEYEGEELPDDFICPLCKHPKSDFKKIEKPVETEIVWRCKICGFEIVADELPDDYICPLCKHPKSDFEKIIRPKTKP